MRTTAHELAEIAELIFAVKRRLKHNLDRKDYLAMDLDFTALNALGSRLDAVAANLTATVSGDVNAAVSVGVANANAANASALTAALAAQTATFQTALDAAVTTFADKVTAVETAAGSANAAATIPTPPAGDGAPG
jgi:hypothetical protein